MAQVRGIQVAVGGTSTMRNLERYRKLINKKEGEYFKIYAPFIKVGARPTRRFSPPYYGIAFLFGLRSPSSFEDSPGKHAANILRVD